jgi:hypothetical protein
MPMYRKTALVDAEQFLPPNSIPAGCYQAGGTADVSAGHGQWMLKTLEGEHSLRRGDYICTGPAGEKWNVAKDIFEATYELAALATPHVGDDVLRDMQEQCAAWIAEGCDSADAISRTREWIDRLSTDTVPTPSDDVTGAVERAVKSAFTFAFAAGFKCADETSRQCASAMDDAWEEYSAIRQIDPATIIGESDRG